MVLLLTVLYSIGKKSATAKKENKFTTAGRVALYKIFKVFIYLNVLYCT
jgi:hypothetical protein